MADNAEKKWGMGPIAAFIEKHRLDEIFNALGPEKIAHVLYEGKTLRFHIPDAMQDKMQLPALVGQLHERSLLEKFRSAVKEKGVICDLGANHGSHMVYFASVMNAEHVHAIEPQAHLIEILKKTVQANNLDNVTLHHAAAGAKKGFAKLKESHEENTGMASFSPIKGDHGDVEIIAVDDIISNQFVSAIKMDVEGMQMPALRGMSKTIRRCKPVLWLELRPAKGEVAQPSEWLAERGYVQHQISFRDFLFIPENQ